MQLRDLRVNSDIELRFWKTKWAHDLYALTDKNREYLKPRLPWVPQVKEVNDSKKFILNCRKSYKSGDQLELSIWYRNELVGCIGFYHIDKTSKKAGLGYWLSSEFYGKGIATISVKTMVNYAFTSLKLNRVEIETATSNHKSCAIPLRLGFTKEGISRESEFIDNQFNDCVIYSMLSREWK